MPLVERVCECGNRWDDLVGVVQGPPVEDCPECGRRSTATALGVFAVDCPGVEKMSDCDLVAALDQKRRVEAEAPRIRSGEVGISTSRRVPLELHPVLPRTQF